MGRIVVGVDGSTGSAAALRWAVELARLRGDEVVALHAYPEVALYPYVAVDCGYIPYDDGLAETVEKRAADLLGQAVDRVTAEVGDDVKIVQEVVAGPAGTALIEAGHHADLIVVGSRGYGPIREVVLGSVSHRVATHATCPVTVVPHGSVS